MKFLALNPLTNPAWETSEPYSTMSSDLPAQHSTLVSEALSDLLTSNFDATSILCLQTCLKLVDSVLSQPLHPKFRQIKLSNKVIHKRIVQTKGGVELLEAIGFTATAAPSIDTMQLSHDWPLPSLQESRSLLAHTLQSTLGVKQVPIMPTVPVDRNAESLARAFNPYQSQHVDGMSQAVGTRLLAPEGWTSHTEQQVAVLKQKQEVIQKTLASHVIPRQWKAWRESSSGSNHSTMSTTISDASSSHSDAQLIAAHAKKQLLQAQATEKQGFTTKAMRDVQRLQKHKVYGETVLKIHFPDGSGVSGHFAPATTTIGQVTQSLLQEVIMEGLFSTSIADKSNHINHTMSKMLQLFTTPPRTLLDPSKTLDQLQLMPAAKVHVQCNLPLTSLNPRKGWFIRDEYFVTNANASVALHGRSGLPQGVALVGYDEANPIVPPAAEESTGLSMTSGPAKKKQNKVDKEALLLQRMMGK